MLGFYLTLIDTAEEKSKFEKIYYQHRAVLITVAYQILKDKYLSEDAVHEAFLALAKNMNKIKDKTCIQIRNYLIIIVKNASYRIYNKRNNEVFVENDFDDIPDLHNIEIDTESRAAQQRLMELIKSLDEKYADVLILKYFYDLSDKEIAESLGITLENAKIRLHRGKNILKSKLSEVNFFD
ncbi:MAG: RNA polymerase sigma factor [Oscillospiraceae bacterium]